MRRASAVLAPEQICRKAASTLALEAMAALVAGAVASFLVPENESINIPLGTRHPLVPKLIVGYR